jgi:hypothetical protein
MKAKETVGNTAPEGERIIMKARETTKSTELKVSGRREHLLRGLGGRAIVAVCTLLAAGVTHAQLLDSVGVQPKGSSAEIVVRFATQVQYSSSGG